MGQRCSCCQKTKNGTSIRMESFRNDEIDGKASGSGSNEEQYQEIGLNDQYPLVVAMYDYEARSHNELGFRKGDLLEVIQKSSDEWWLARIINTEIQAFVPVPFTASSSSLESQEWYFGVIPRAQAEQLLLSNTNRIGAFLIRYNQTTDQYALSVVVENVATGGIRIKHYRILQTDSQNFYFPSTHRVFHTLNDLVDYHLHTDELEISRYMDHPCERHRPNITVLPPPEDQFQVQLHDIDLGDMIGQGHYGFVYKGTLRNLPVAIKTLKEGCNMTSDEFLQEARIMKHLNHPNIISLHGICTDQGRNMIITEFMPCGSLLEDLRKRGERRDPYDFPCQLIIAAKIAKGMEYLETNKLIHRDLAARNVLMGHNLECKVADFGLARICADVYNPTSGVTFPVKWTALEALLHNRFTIKSDIWSFGILVIEIVTEGAIPYPGMDNNEIVMKLLKKYRMPKPPTCDEGLYEELLKCWNEDPDLRPTFSHLVDFFSDYENHLNSNYYGEQCDATLPQDLQQHQEIQQQLQQRQQQQRPPQPIPKQ